MFGNQPQLFSVILSLIDVILILGNERNDWYLDKDDKDDEETREMVES